jgi:glyceraldehyde 3-phosphate dehydrogenase
MPITIGLMGFGRIGRNLFRILHDRSDARIGVISDIADPEALTYLLRYDTILGRFPDLVTYKGGYLYTVGKEIPFVQGRDPGDVDWARYGVDYVVEATGRDRPRSAIQKHLEAGARRVLLCVPPSDEPDRSIVYGVNHDSLQPDDRMISNASCTAHSAAPILRVLHDVFGLERAHLSVVHAYSSVQRLADVPADELRLSRAAAENIVPADTNAGHVLDEILPDLAGRISASALRVPVANGSIVDMTLWFENDMSADRINEVMRTAAAGPYRRILEYATDPIVSSDVVSSPHSSIYDSLATMSLGTRQAKVITWFDNSWGYTHRLLDLIWLCARQDGLASGGEA